MMVLMQLLALLSLHTAFSFNVPSSVSFNKLEPKHLRDWVTGLQPVASPWRGGPQNPRPDMHFVDPKAGVLDQVVVDYENPGPLTFYPPGGPREQVFFEADEVRAAIITCGGICPGLNTVVREVVNCLWNQYGVRSIHGIKSGYMGFYKDGYTMELTPDIVDQIHKRGGTFLGTSRGGHDTQKITDAIEAQGFNQVYIIGGDGTMKGAMAITEEVEARALKCSVVHIPKTIDNDIPGIDRSFGFETSVCEARKAIEAGHTEATSFPNGLSIIRLMGRHSGFIAMHATLSSRDVDCCLIPEVDFFLEGEGGLMDFLHQRMQDQGYVVLVVAEGAGQSLLADAGGVDVSGNTKIADIGIWIKDQLAASFKGRGVPVSMKYIDPTYMVRAVPANAGDSVYCTLTAHAAVHGSFAGYTEFMVGPVNGRQAYIPLSSVVGRRNVVNPNDRMWARLVSSTGQPGFQPTQECEESLAGCSVETGY